MATTRTNASDPLLVKVRVLIAVALLRLAEVIVAVAVRFAPHAGFEENGAKV